VVSDYVISKIEHLKRKHDPDCGVGSWCDCGADRFNKEVDWIISEVRAANAMESANLQAHNSATDAICAIAAQSRNCKWADGSSGCSSPVQCPHKLAQQANNSATVHLRRTTQTNNNTKRLHKVYKDCPECCGLGHPNGDINSNYCQRCGGIGKLELMVLM